MWDKTIYMHLLSSVTGRFLAPGAKFADLPLQLEGVGEQAGGAGMQKPLWGNGGEDRVRGEFAAACEKGFNKHWYYQMIMKKVEKKQAAKQPV